MWMFPCVKQSHVYNENLRNNIPPSSSAVLDRLGPLPDPSGRKAGAPWMSRQLLAGTAYGDTQSQTLAFTPTVHLESPVIKRLCLWEEAGGENPHKPWENMQTQKQDQDHLQEFFQSVLVPVSSFNRG